MNAMLWTLFIAVLLVIGAQILMLYRVATLRRSGEYPKPGNATMADVERLLRSGKRGLAMRCYREIHPCSLRQASDALDNFLAKR